MEPLGSNFYKNISLNLTCSFWKIKNIVKEILDVTKKVIMCGYGSLTVPKIEIFLLIYLWMMLLD